MRQKVIDAENGAHVVEDLDEELLDSRDTGVRRRIPNDAQKLCSIDAANLG